MQELHEETFPPPPSPEGYSSEMVQVSSEEDPEPVIAVVGVPADQMGTPIAQKLIVDLALLKTYNTYKAKRRCLMWYSIAGSYALAALTVLHCFVFAYAWEELERFLSVINIIRTAFSLFIVLTAYRCFKEIMPEENRVAFHHRRYKVLGFILVLSSLAKVLTVVYFNKTGHYTGDELTAVFVEFTISTCIWTFVFWFVHEHFEIYSKNKGQFEKLREENPALFIV